LTDTAGNFSLTSHNTANKVCISFIGYKTQETAVNTFKDFARITLERDGAKLDEVIVVGYGTAVKKDLTGAVSTLSGNLISERKVTQLSQALQGSIPGVAVTRNSGNPGSGGTILIRGVTKLGVNDPLVIVDGMPGSLDNINPDDVDNISVLKDAASSAIYGSRAVAGVILGSETASTVSSRGIYKFPVELAKGKTYDDNQSSSYDLEACPWSQTPDDEFVRQDDLNDAIGEFVWTGFDYLGEPMPYDTQWPSYSSYFGIVDIADIPKDRYYLYRSRWNPQKAILHILPH
jgi:TonB-dependent SusC/RagA subfamily outer membrane receptor